MREKQSTVAAAAVGDQRALDQLVEAYLPLVYNIVGWAMAAHADVDDVVQETMLQVIRGLPGLRDAQRFRSWLIAMALQQVRGRWRARAYADERLDVAGTGADFVDLAIAHLQLTGQRREVAEATRWLDGDDRELLSLWWLESAGQFTRGELAEALRLSTSDVTHRVRRMRAELDAARVVIRALHATPQCSVLDELLQGWDGWPSSLWRKRLARHTRECPECDRWWAELVPADRLLVGATLVTVPAGLTAKVLGQPSGGTIGGGGDTESAWSGSTTGVAKAAAVGNAAFLRAQTRGMALTRRRAVAVIAVAAAGGVAAATAAVLSGRHETARSFVATDAAAHIAVPTSGASASVSATPSGSPSPKAADPGADPGVDPVFTTDPDLYRSETYRYQVTKPGDHALPAGTVSLQYDVSKAAASPLKGELARIRDGLARGSGLALYLAGGAALNDTDLTALQTLHKPETSGGLGLTNLRRLYVYNLRSLQGGQECTPTSGLACAGQTARGGDWPYLWYNGWWDTWVKDLVLDDLDEVKDGSFSNHNFASVSLRGARTIGVMAFGHAPYAPLAVVYLPSATTIGRDAFRRNQYLLKVNLPRAVTVDDFAFDDTSRLQYFAAPNLESIGRNGLNDTHALRAVHLPSLTYMGINCFDLNGDAAHRTGVKVLRLPKLQTLDKNAITGFAALQRVWAPVLTTAWQYSIANNRSLQSVYAPGLRKLGPGVFASNPALRAVYLGTQPPAQDAAAFTGTDAAKLTLYHPPGEAAWRAFRPAGNPALHVVEQ